MPSNYIKPINSMANRVKTFTYNNQPCKSFDKLNFLYTNAISLSNKWEEFNSLIYYLNRPHIILVTETWFGKHSITNLCNYTSYLCNREDTIEDHLKPKRGGGVVAYIRADLTSLEVTDNILSSKEIEQSWCSIKTENESILIGCIYRPPNSTNVTSNRINISLRRAKPRP